MLKHHRALLVTLLGAGLAGLAPRSGQAQPAVSVFAPPVALKLMKHKDPASVMPGANWTIAQFSSPDPFTAFVGNTAASSAGSVTMGPPGSFSMAATGAALPCTKTYPSGMTAVTEYDELATPKKLPKGTALPLSALHHAILSGTVSAAATGPFDLQCKMNVVSVADALTITNNTAKSVMAYQLRLGLFAAHGNVIGDARKTPPSDWFSRGKNGQTGTHGFFGYDDSLPVSYDTPLLQNNATMNYSVDILPRIKALIAQGAAFGMDQNLDDWHITGEYIGSALWGHVAVHTGWAALSLVEN